MTSDMAFECLFVSRDPELFRITAGILRSLSISIDVCNHASTAFETLQKTDTELLVLDWDGEECSELMQRICREPEIRKPTVVAISTGDRPIPGAHIVIKKPMTSGSGAKSFKAAYQRMLLDYRRHVRHPLMVPVTAKTEDSREVAATVIDIGDGGVGLCSRQSLIVGDILSFRVPLPGTPQEVMVRVRVVWTRQNARLGCEFVRLPAVDLMILHDWLKTKCCVKKPLIKL
jgi:hypothetical protein